MSLEDDRLIESYLQETLSVDEKKDFLNRVESDAEFKKKFLFEKQLFQTLSEKEWGFGNHNPKDVKAYRKLFESEETKELERMIKSVNTDYQKSKKQHNLTKWIYSSAAMIALLISVYALFFKSVSTQELYAEYIEKTELPSLIVRGENQNKLALAQQYFENSEYDKALEIFKKEIENTKIQDATIYLYIGISQLELNQFDDAEKTFDLLIESDLIDAPKGKWYKALTYIKRNDIDKAKELLNEIIETSSYNSEQAKNLLQEL